MESDYAEDERQDMAAEAMLDAASDAQSMLREIYQGEYELYLKSCKKIGHTAMDIDDFIEESRTREF